MRQELYDFLIEVDKLFPVPLSEREPLALLASKLEQYGTLSCLREEGKIIALCAGYTNDSKNHLGYISVVASLTEYSNKGYAKVVVQNFIEKAKMAGMMAIHLYTDKNNNVALHLYEELGFTVWSIENEPRPEDRHLIRYL